MKCFLDFSERRIVKKDVFKNGLANIIVRNVEDEIYFELEDIQKAQ